MIWRTEELKGWEPQLQYSVLCNKPEMISNWFYFCWQDGNQYVVLEVIQLNDAGGRADSSQVVSDIQEEEEDIDDEEAEEDIIVKKELEVKPKMSTRKGKGEL